MDVLNGLELRGRRITGLADPTAPQDAATKAYVDAHGGGGSAGWTRIGAAVNAAGGASVSFTAIPAIYSDLMLVFEGVSHNNGSSSTLTCELSGDNGATWTTGTTTLSGAAYPATAAIYGTAKLFGYRLPAGAVMTSLADLGADRTMGSANAQNAYRLAAGVNAIRIGVSAGAFDAGTISLFARA